MYRKILVPLDGSELAECALPHVRHMAKDGFVEEVVLINIVWVKTWPYAYNIEMLGSFDADVRERAKAEAGKYLADVESRLRAEGIKVKAELLEGYPPAAAISDYAREQGIDLIVIATHGYTGLKKMMLGSVTLQILHDSHVPVFLVRPESCRA